MYDIPFIILFYILAGFFLGMYLDGILKFKIPIFTILLTSTGFIGGIWTVIKRLNKP